MVMIKVNLAEAKAKLSEYLDRAVAGDHIVICRHNAPVAELRPVARAQVDPRPIGPLAGRPAFDVPAAFFEPLSNDDLDSWEGLASSAIGGGHAAPRVAERKSDYRAAARPRKRRS